jgi:hypothetical protein
MTDDGVQRLARLEGKMESVSESVQRIESAIQRLMGPIDRNLTELQMNVRHMDEKLQDTREQTAACNEGHKASTKALTTSIDAVSKQASALESKATAGLRVAVWFCGVFSAIVFAAGGWIFAQVGKNTEINAVQQQRIDQMEKQLLDVREEARKK